MKKKVCINIPKEMNRKTAEWLLNYKSHLTINPDYPYEKICLHSKTKFCFECEQPECDMTGLIWEKLVSKNRKEAL